MRYRVPFSMFLAVLPATVIYFLAGCGGNGSSNPIIGTWTGQITRAAQSLSLSITFKSNGTNVTGQAVLALLDEPSFHPSFLAGFATFPVTVTASGVSFTADFVDNSSTNVLARSIANPANQVLIVVPGRSTGDLSATLTLSNNTLAGNYQIGGASPHSGAITLTRSQAPPSFDGHWTGSMTSNLGQSPTTMNLFLASDSASPNRVRAADTAASQVNTSLVTNTWGVPQSFGIDAIVVDHDFFCNLNFVVNDPTGTANRIFPHRYLKGTLNGSTISGVYKDEFTGGGLPNDSGTFTLTKQ